MHVVIYFICNVLHEYIKYYLYGIYIFVYHCIAFLHIAFFPDSSRFLLAFLLPLVEKTSTGASQNPSKHCYMSGSQIDSVAAGTAPTKAKQTLPRAEGLRYGLKEVTHTLAATSRWMKQHCSRFSCESFGRPRFQVTCTFTSPVCQAGFQPLPPLPPLPTVLSISRALSR